MPDQRHQTFSAAASARRKLRAAGVLATVLVALALGLAAVASARTWNRADATYVENHLTKYWNTSDGERIVDASCNVWWGHLGHVVREYGEWFSSAWQCKEVDDVERLFYAHVRINQYGALHVIQYRCDDSGSAYGCP